MKVNLFALPNFLTFASIFFVGLFVFSKKSNDSAGRNFFLLTLTAAAWQLGTALVLSSTTADRALFFCRATYLGSLFIPLMSYHLILAALDQAERYKKLSLALNILWFAVFLPVSQSPWFVSGVYLYPWGYWWRSDTMPHMLFLTALSSVMSFSFYLLFKAIRLTTSGLEKARRQYLLFALGIAYVGAVDYAPNYGFRIYPFGYLPLLAYIMITSYAIIRYRFLDIEVIIKKTLVFAGLFSVFMLVVGGVTAISQSFVGQYLKMGMVANSLASVFFAMLFYEPVRKALINLTDKYLFQKKFNLTSIVTQGSEAIALVQSLKWLSKRIVAFLITKCRIKSAVIYSRSRDNQHFKRGAMRGFERDESLPPILRMEHPIVQSLLNGRHVIECQRLEEQIQKKAGDGTGTLKEMAEILKSLKVEAIIPSFLRSRIDASGMGKEKELRDMDLRNILVLGGKKSDEPYLDEELEIFYGLAQESSIAIENARLYDEAVERTRLLEQTNTNLSEANEKLKVTQASLIVAEKNATMVGMAKAIGHEVNNPLSTVAGRAGWIYRDELPVFKDLIKDEPVVISPEYAKKMKKAYANIDHNARKVEQSAKRIEIVVKTLTDILKDTKGEIGPLSLLVLFREAREATRFVTYEENLSGCQIKEDIASNLIIMGNLEQLMQVFVNLIKNAYEAMEKQTNRQIIIRGNPDPEDPAMARIEVEDNGPGMPPEVLTNIWKQGFTTKVRTSEQIGAVGQGQGLFICKHMIESVHNGSLSATSIPGQGTTFIIKLPMADIGG